MSPVSTRRLVKVPPTVTKSMQDAAQSLRQTWALMECSLVKISSVGHARWHAVDWPRSVWPDVVVCRRSFFTESIDQRIHFTQCDSQPFNYTRRKYQQALHFNWMGIYLIYETRCSALASALSKPLIESFQIHMHLPTSPQQLSSSAWKNARQTLYIVN
jgi:hypothetical protein